MVFERAIMSGGLDIVIMEVNFVRETLKDNDGKWDLCTFPVRLIQK